MRKTKKSVFYDFFTPINDFYQSVTPAHVIYGGFLLHRVSWESKEKITSILLKYVEYLKKNYGTKATVVFYGYPEESSKHGSKYAERIRRKNKYIAACVNFNETTPPNKAQRTLPRKCSTTYFMLFETWKKTV